MVTPEVPEATKAAHGRYAITYFDPEDEEGMRDKTWVFRTREEAEEWKRELGVVWETLEGEVEIVVEG